MIALLEYIIFFNALGGLTVSFAFYKTFFPTDMIMLGISLVYILLPMEDISKALFPTTNTEEVNT
jgi:hypothetical protein